MDDATVHAAADALRSMVSEIEASLDLELSCQAVSALCPIVLRAQQVTRCREKAEEAARTAEETQRG